MIACTICSTTIDPEGTSELPWLCTDPACREQWAAERTAEGYASIVELPERFVARGLIGSAWAVALTTASVVPDPPPSDP